MAPAASWCRRIAAKVPPNGGSSTSPYQPQRACPGIKGQEHRRISPMTRVECTVLLTRHERRRVQMSEAMTRRNILGFLGVALLGLGAPPLLTQPAEAQPAVVVVPAP